MKSWNVYLAGEIHSDWRREIAEGVREAGLPVALTAPVVTHDESDACGTKILGNEEKNFWADHKGAGINAIRTRTLIGDADIVVVKFGGKYRQWNAAFDAGFASALGTPIIVVHEADLTHALKEVDRAALAVAENADQVVAILRYVIEQA